MTLLSANSPRFCHTWGRVPETRSSRKRIKVPHGKGREPYSWRAFGGETKVSGRPCRHWITSRQQRRMMKWNAGAGWVCPNSAWSTQSPLLGFEVARRVGIFVHYKQQMVKRPWGRWRGSAEKSIQAWFPTLLGLLTTIWNSSSPGPSTLFWPECSRHVCGAQTFIWAKHLYI